MSSSGLKCIIKLSQGYINYWNLLQYSIAKQELYEIQVTPYLVESRSSVQQLFVSTHISLRYRFVLLLLSQLPPARHTISLYTIRTCRSDPVFAKGLRDKTLHFAYIPYQSYSYRFNHPDFIK